MTLLENKNVDEITSLFLQVLLLCQKIHGAKKKCLLITCKKESNIVLKKDHCMAVYLPTLKTTAHDKISHIQHSDIQKILKLKIPFFLELNMQIPVKI